MLDLLRIVPLLFISVLVVPGCSRETPTIRSGMPMRAATAALDGRGLKSQQMAIEGTHFAIELPDGRMIVLMGEAVVDAILLIENADEPKASRRTNYVSTFDWQ